MPLLSTALESLPLVGATPSLNPAAAPASPLQENRRITEGYIQLAGALQAVLDPSWQPGAPSGLRPNWFVFAPHASQSAGKGMYCAAMARRLIDTARLRPMMSMGQLLEAQGITGAERASTEALTLLFKARGIPSEAALPLSVLLSALNWKALLDPRTAAAVSSRFSLLYLQAPGLLPLDKAESVARTLERTLYEGNVVIFSDIGASGSAFLQWRGEQQGKVTPERVLTGFSRPGSRPEHVRQAYDWGLAHAADTPRPSDLGRLLPEMNSQSLVVAAFALYENARSEQGLAAREALIAMANNFVAWREQATVLQPCFVPPLPSAGEVPRPALMLGLTPLLRVEFGTVEWNFSDYASAQPDSDSCFLTSQPTEYNWAHFEHRWPAILDAFEKGYQEPTGLWKMPEPLVD